MLRHEEALKATLAQLSTNDKNTILKTMLAERLRAARVLTAENVRCMAKLIRRLK